MQDIYKHFTFYQVLLAYQLRTEAL